MASQGNGAFDRYAYVNNNPVRYTDPGGHIACDESHPCKDIEGADKNPYNKIQQLLALQREYQNRLKAIRIALNTYQIGARKPDNCTAFVSTVLNKAGLPTVEGAWSFKPYNKSWENTPANYGWFSSPKGSSNVVYENNKWNYNELDDARPGDLVYFSDNGSNNDFPYDHVAIIVGFSNSTTDVTTLGIRELKSDAEKLRTEYQIPNGNSRPLIVDNSAYGSPFGPRSIDDISSVNVKITIVSVTVVQSDAIR